ncbi:histidine kinase [Catenulispora acidiphila DSM 44928]|uniref:histidine kinase n=1 Tax=Catenulispora acidiphila (strain DSM 44928 / JCM 14897 / NBRC 102108 / NRRL B-24433 / ID139908) TaxID=479433 RepID=C7PX19_CATAD|nr:HAMP domain-containing sensor histidine kinase [Catenulispora acidiphila]ACU77276.1 histidine kinase [Catenulispora acidiphila DSM 44928]
MSTTTAGTDTGGPAGGNPASKDPYIRGTDETVLLDLRELRAQEAADRAAREAAAAGASAAEDLDHETPEASADSTAAAASSASSASSAPGTELERYHGSHRRDAVLYADGGTAIPLDRVREVCHDLRQPVAAILMLASAAELRPDVPERVRDVLQEIMSQTEEISATVRQFLDDAKQGVDGLGEPVPCNVAGLAAESVERWRATFDGDLALAAAEDPLHVTVDPVLFKRALGNVLSNGTRAAGDSGRVQVTVRRFETAEGERAVIEVDDSGPGFGNIPAGHGLGLAVVRRTIEAAGGSVEFAEGPLGGALVRLVLPVTPIRPLSADDELTKTFHGEISLTQLAAQLAAGGVHRALADFEDFDDLDDLDELDAFDEGFTDDFEDEDDFAEVIDVTEPPASLTGGHAFMTRLSAWPEPMAISGTPEQLAIGGSAEPANLFGPRTPEQLEPAATADNRTYFGLPLQHSLPAATDEQPPARKSPDTSADTGYFGLPLKTNTTSHPSATTLENGATEDPQTPPNRLYGTPADITAHPVPASVFPPTPHNPTPQAPGEITAAAHQPRTAPPTTPQPSLTAPFATPAAPLDAPDAAQASGTHSPQPAAAAAPTAAQPSATRQPSSAGPVAPQTTAAAPMSQPATAATSAAAPEPSAETAAQASAPANFFGAPVAPQAATQSPAASMPQPATAPTSAAVPEPSANFFGAPVAPQAATQPSAASMPQPATAPTSAAAPEPSANFFAAPVAPQAATQPSAAPTPQPTTVPTSAAAPEPSANFFGAPVAPLDPAEAAQSSAAHLPYPAGLAAPPFAAPSAAQTPAAAAGPAAPAAAEAPTDPTSDPSFDPADTQPLHIIPTGQDDTALASIQLPSQATLTHPPRIPASALQPVASVQLSLLPGGAF